MIAKQILQRKAINLLVLLLPMVLQACSSTPNLDAQWGSAVQQAKTEQIACAHDVSLNNCNAPKQPAAAASMAVEHYILNQQHPSKSFEVLQSQGSGK